MMETLMNGQRDTQNFGGHNIIPSPIFVVRHKMKKKKKKKKKIHINQNLFITHQLRFKAKSVLLKIKCLDYKEKLPIMVLRIIISKIQSLLYVSSMRHDTEHLITVLIIHVYLED